MLPASPKKILRLLIKPKLKKININKTAIYEKISSSKIKFPSRKENNNIEIKEITTEYTVNINVLMIYLI